jgi:hypothetical protein
MKSQPILSINQFDVMYALDDRTKVNKAQLAEIADIMSDKLRADADETFWDTWQSCLEDACKEVLKKEKKPIAHITF